MEQPSVHISPSATVSRLRRMLANMDVYLNRDSRLLEFGCGSGSWVYEFRDAGFDAYGFDIASYVNLRQPNDEQYFKFALTGKPAHVPEYGIDGSSYRIPFEDGLFDLVFSGSVFEHVMNYDIALAEISRVLGPGGVAIHTFPSRYIPIEPHIFVPFGAAIQNYPWYLLWALLGVRNQFQHHLGPVARAKVNCHYAGTGLNYLKIKDILNISRRHFREVRLVPHLWEMIDQGDLSLKGRLIHGLPLGRRIFRWIYNRFWTVVLFVRK